MTGRWPWRPLRWDRTAVPTLLTIHNLAYRGCSPTRLRGTGVPAEHLDELHFHGQMSFLGGITNATRLNTVSLRYAQITARMTAAGCMTCWRVAQPAGT